jgi:molecular chaperone GrpE
LDSVIKSYLESGAFVEKLEDMLTKYLVEGSTGNKLLDQLIKNYLDTGKTGNDLLDKLINSYIDELMKDLDEKKVAELEEKAAKDKDDYIRLMAEFDNFRRRTSQEKIELISMASTETIKGMLPVLDDCERALAVLKDSDDSNAAKEGTELIYHKLMAYLQSKGLAVIEAKNQVFDTDLHEAVAQFPVPEEEMKGKVFDVVQTGYTLNGKVIRFAKVVVGI